LVNGKYIKERILFKENFTEEEFEKFQSSWAYNKELKDYEKKVDPLYREDKKESEEADG
jgi:hypothetical protein